jgi:glycosyltransferase involved in cell wall biosynthesis
MLKFISGNSRTIIINATNIGYKMNGIGNYTLNLVKHFVKLSTQINYIIYFNRSSSVHLESIDFPNNFDVRWVSKWLSPDKKFLGHLLRLIYSNFLALKHFNTLQFNTSPLEVCFFKSNQIVTVHDVIPILFKKFHKKQYHFYKVILKYVLRSVQMVITPSLYTKELVHKYYQLDDSKVVNIPLAIDTLSIENNNADQQRRPYLLYVGRINEMKNVIKVIRSFIIVSNSLDLELIVVGDDKFRFNQLLVDAKCDEHTKSKISFHQNVTNGEKYQLMKNASAFVYPTLFEGFGFPPLEAMSCGCPVIVSDNSSLPEVCGDAAYYVNPEDENEIARGIIEVLSDKNLKSQLRARGFERVQLYSWERTIYNHLSIINRVLNKPPAVINSKTSLQKPLILSEEKF